jgi:hypothetical protein
MPLIPDAAGVRPATACTLHGVVFDILPAEPPRRGVAAGILLEAVQVPFQLPEWLAIRAGRSNGNFHMTFIIEATKDDHRTVDFRSTAIVAVILARKLVAEGVRPEDVAAIRHLYLADQFNLC